MECLAQDWEQNFAWNSDSYKASHPFQFPPGTEEMFYYQEPRIEGVDIKVFGPQIITKKHFCSAPTRKQVADAAAFWKEHGEPFYEDGWNYIADLGYLPLEIRSVPEGLVVPSKNVLTTYRSTDPKCFWLPGWAETLSIQTWYPITVCTISYQCKLVILKWLEKTGTVEDIAFKLHDFGFRGATSLESAGIYAAAHLMNFIGTDTPPGIHVGRKYYNTRAMLGFSIPAAEHSTVISWGFDNEEMAYANMLKLFGGKGKLVAVVSDSYDLSNAVRNIWCGSLKRRVIESGCTLVVRPDSGDPSKVVVRTLNELKSGFGGAYNDKGYFVLAPSVRVIQGDGIASADAIDKILSAVAEAGFSADNLAFGMGGGLAQHCDRDTLMFAEKNSAIKINGVWYDVCKNPKDAPWKASKKGQLTLAVDSNNQYATVDLKDVGRLGMTDVMQTIFRNGEMLVDETFETIRNR